MVQITLRSGALLRRLIAALVCTFAASTVIADQAPSQGDTTTRANTSNERFERGRRVFHRKCIKCHGSGRENAPVVGRPGDWAMRLDQPESVLVTHALEGHRGPGGQMPPKGGFASLSDDDVGAAVHYIAVRGRWLARRIEDQNVACVKDQATQDCVPFETNDASLLRFLWLLQETAESR